MFSNIREQINQEFDRIETLIESELNALEQRSIVPEREKTISLAAYKPQEQWDQDQSNLTISIPLPGFKQKDISVTISETLENETVTKRTLDVLAKGKVITQKHAISNKDGHTTQTHAEHHVSAKTSFLTSDGRLQKICYTDGNVQLNLQLPEGINTQGYEMSFENEQLTLLFKNINNT